MAAQFVQDPVAVLDYNVDWSAWLNGDTLASSAWITSADLTTSSMSFSNTLATVYIAGGTAGRTYKVKNKITTTNGRTEEETFDLMIRTH